MGLARQAKKSILVVVSDLKELTTWTNNWLLKFHPGKCKVMKYGKTQGTGAFNYTLCSDSIDHVLEKPTNETDLGVILFFTVT